MHRSTGLVSVTVGVLGLATALAGCAADEPLQLWLRQTDRAVRHMTLAAHLADQELSLPPADEFANYVDGQTVVQLTSVSGSQMFYLHLDVPRDLLADPTFAPGSRVVLRGDALVPSDVATNVQAYVSDPVLRAAVEICEGTYSPEVFCCYDVHPASEVELTFEPCDTPGRVHVIVHARIEDAADGTPQSVDATFDLGPS